MGFLIPRSRPSPCPARLAGAPARSPQAPTPPPLRAVRRERTPHGFHRVAAPRFVSSPFRDRFFQNDDCLVSACSGEVLCPRACRRTVYTGSPPAAIRFTPGLLGQIRPQLQEKVSCRRKASPSPSDPLGGWVRGHGHTGRAVLCPKLLILSIRAEWLFPPGTRPCDPSRLDSAVPSVPRRSRSYQSINQSISMFSLIVSFLLREMIIYLSGSNICYYICCVSLD